MPPSKLKSPPTSPFEGTPSTGWRPTRTRVPMKREVSGAPPTPKDDEAPLDHPDNGTAAHGAASSRKI